MVSSILLATSIKVTTLGIPTTVSVFPDDFGSRAREIVFDLPRSPVFTSSFIRGLMVFSLSSIFLTISGAVRRNEAPGRTPGLSWVAQRRIVTSLTPE